MQEYKHYGVPVVRQYRETDFKEDLKKRGILYTDLPILEHDVIRYQVVGATRYALIRPAAESGSWVYITAQVPDDLDFGFLVTDVDLQVSGKEPAHMETKLHKMLAFAEKKALEKKETDDFFAMPEVSVKEIAFAFGILFGTQKEEFRSMDASDVDSDFLEEMLSYLG